METCQALYTYPPIFMRIRAFDAIIINYERCNKYHTKKAILRPISDR
jgi:hypothetical protein